MKPLKPSQSRALAVLLLVVVLLLLVRVLLWPLWLSLSDYGERIDSLENRIEVYQRLIAGVDADRQRLAELQSSLPTTDWYLSEATPALAAASLQQLLLSQVNRAGGQLISTQIINTNGDTPLPAISIQVHIRGELDELVDLLYTLESSKPVLFIDNLTVLANPRRQVSARAQRRTQRQSIPALDIRFDLTGYTARESS
ncbi:hypothetical protein GCM10009104_18030 [Marinobacterium maritimum]|uniref:General secretion pathway protein M n=1 Tax=Marinobacterium maritimum TaxID=500162 RepID=A0ABP3TBF8_9GAMM